MKIRAALVFLIGLAAQPVLAQTRPLRLLVLDSLGSPIAGAEARVSPGDRSVKTDSVGRATIVLAADAAQLSVRRLGYRPASITLTSPGRDSLRVVMAELVVEVDGMKISALMHPFVEGFDRRRRQGSGAFITPRQIEDRRPSVASDVFRQQPMIRLVRLQGGATGLRFPGILSIRRSSEDCVPMIWVDGQRAPGMEIDDIRAGDLLAIEIYRGASVVPMEFASGGKTQCGAIVVWTKRYFGTRK